MGISPANGVPVTVTTIDYPKYDWSKIVKVKEDPTYNEKMQKFLLGQESMKKAIADYEKKGYKVNVTYHPDGWITGMSADYLGKRNLLTGEETPYYSKEGKSSTPAVASTGTGRTTGSSTGIVDSVVNTAKNVAGKAMGLITGSTTPAQQEQDFSKFVSKDTINYEAKTAEDMDEARQTLLKAGYVKVGIDKDGKEYYEKRTSSADNTYKPTESWTDELAKYDKTAAGNVSKTDWSIPETIADTVSKYSSSSSGGVSTPEVVTDPSQAGAIRLDTLV